jgi:hypothetical protein
MLTRGGKGLKEGLRAPREVNYSLRMMKEGQSSSSVLSIICTDRCEAVERCVCEVLVLDACSWSVSAIISLSVDDRLTSINATVASREESTTPSLWKPCFEDNTGVLRCLDGQCHATNVYGD